MTASPRTNLFTAYVGRNADGDRVFVEVDTENQHRVAQTTDHEHIAHFPSLSLSGWTLRYRTNSWGSGGQIRGELFAMREIARGWTLDDVISLRMIWKNYHLNDMVPGCAHMDTAGLAPGYDARKHLVCPETGYRYGSAHLVQQIPADVWTEIHRLSELPRGEVTRGNG